MEPRARPGDTQLSVQEDRPSRRRTSRQRDPAAVEVEQTWCGEDMRGCRWANSLASLGRQRREVRGRTGLELGLHP